MRPLAMSAICLLFNTPGFARAKIPYGLPRGARVIDAQSLKSSGYPNRLLVLWMIKPSTNPSRGDAGEPYTCPDYTRGSCLSGLTRVSLIDTRENRVINTVKVADQHLLNKDTFDIPYAMRENDYYHLEGKPDRNGERKARVLFLKDYNGDGKALEFSLYDAIFCMGLSTTLIGYSAAQDRVIQYPIVLRVVGTGKRSNRVYRWVDYLFAEKPIKPGYWKYDIDYRSRGGHLDKYEITYNSKFERFEGQLTVQTESR